MAGLAQLLALVLLLAQVAAPPAPEAKAEFEVAAIKRNTSAEANGTLQMRPGGYFRAVNFNIFNLVAFAFRTHSRNLFRTQIAGLPEWTAAARYDIDAKMNREQFDAMTEDPLRTPKVVRALLEDRFKLRTHVEQREQAVYDLIVLKPGQLGPQIHLSTADCDRDPSRCGRIRSGAGRHFIADSITIETLAGLVQGTAGRVVVDHTGLRGYFDVELEWAEDETVTDKPSMFAALQEQLGLKLEPAREPVDVIVVDHIERPTED